MIPQIIANGIIAGSLYSLVALGFTLVYGTARFFHFAHGGIYTAGAYITYSLFTLLGVNMVFSASCAITVCILLGIALDSIGYRPLRRRNAQSLVFFVSSLGMFIVIQNVVAILFGNRIRDFSYASLELTHTLLGAIVTSLQLLILVFCFLVMLGLAFLLKRTRLGKSMRAVSEDYEGALIVGIDREHVIRLAFAIASALAAIAGILIGLEQDLEPTMGTSAILKGIIASVIGGIGNIPGAVCGAFLLGLAENLAIWRIPSVWKDGLGFAVLLAFLFIRPTGFFGAKQYKEEV